MADMILDVQTLPEMIFSRFSTEKVKIREENGTFILTPVSGKEKSFDRLIGMFSDGKLSIDNYLEEKQHEKEFEN